MFGIKLDYLFFHAMLTVGVAGMGLFIRSCYITTLRQTILGWLALVPTVGGVAAAGLVMLGLGYPAGKEYLAGAVAGGGFGFLCGLGVGRFVWKHYRKEIEGEE